MKNIFKRNKASEMKVVPKRKRIKFYKLLRKCYDVPYVEYEDFKVEGIQMNHSVGFCGILNQIQLTLHIVDGYYCPYDEYLKDFPELYKHKPLNQIYYWYPYDEKGYQQRKKIINAVCKDLNI